MHKRKIVCVLDPNLLEWYESLPPRSKSFYVNDAIRRGLIESDQTDVLTALEMVGRNSESIEVLEERQNMIFKYFNLLVEELQSKGLLDGPSGEEESNTSLASS